MESKYVNPRRDEQIIARLRELEEKSLKRMRKFRQKIVLELMSPPHMLGAPSIAERLGVPITTVNFDISKLVEKGKLKRIGKGQFDFSPSNGSTLWKRRVEINSFKEKPTVRNWYNILGKNSLKYANTNLAYLWVVCKTLDIEPDVLLGDIAETDRLFNEFTIRLRDGDAIGIKKRNLDPEKQSKISPLNYARAVKSYLVKNEKLVPKGFIDVKQDTPKIFGQVQFNDYQLSQLKSLATAEETGIFRKLFIMHHELGVRVDTLFNMMPIFHRKVTVIDGVECEYFIADIYERKQTEVYQKLIFTPEARDIARNHEDGKTLHEFPDDQVHLIKKEYPRALKQCYEELGLISTAKDYDRNSKEWYLKNRPTHSVRHSTVHWLMRISGNSIPDVSSMFWETPETLKTYHRRKIDSFLQSDICYICNKPKTADRKEIRFCSFKHALKFYNYSEQKRNEVVGVSNV